MKIVLVNLPWKKSGRTGVRAGSRWPHLKGPAEIYYLPFPFFLAYAAALLRKNGFEVILLDAVAEGLSRGQFLEFVAKHKPDLLVCETSTVTLEYDLELLRKVDKRVPQALCGPDINIRRPDFLAKHRFVDYVFTGEYEFTLLDLVKRLDRPAALDEVLGLIYRDGDQVKVNPKRPLGNLDDLPWPLREGLPMHKYNDTPGDMVLPSVQMYASRGCPYRCKFCLWPQVMYGGNQYRARDVKDVVDEMEYLVKKMNFKSVYFDDDTFNCGKQRIMELAEQIRKRKLNVPWAIMARPDLMDEELLTCLKDAGLYAVKYGVESAEQRLLDNIDKNMNINRTIEIIKFTRMLGIKTHLTFAFGLPGETRESLRKTTELALMLEPDSVQFSIATPFPGTVFYDEMKEKGFLSSRKWSEFDGNNRSVICTDTLKRKDLENAVRGAYKKWVELFFKRRALRKNLSFGYYYVLFRASLNRNGAVKTVLKIFRHLYRNAVIYLKDSFSYHGQVKGNKKGREFIRSGKLLLVFEANGLNLYWKGMKLTRDAGLITSVDLGNGKTHRSSMGGWSIEKINEEMVLVRMKYGILPIEETWTMKILNQHEIYWKAEITAESPVDIRKKTAALILSGRYRKWMDNWGEGYLLHANDLRAVELRNPQSSFIGLKGRPRLSGKLPTILFDEYKITRSFAISVRNAVQPFGARIVEIGSGSCRDSEIAGAKELLFEGKLRVYEHNLTKKQK